VYPEYSFTGTFGFADTIGTMPAESGDYTGAPGSDCSDASFMKRFTPTVRAALLLVVAIAVAPALAVIAWTGMEHGKHLSAQARAEMQRQADAFAVIQEGKTEAAQQVLASIASLAPVRTGDLARIDSILKSVHEVNPGHLNYTMTDTKGIVVASSRLKPGVDLSGRPHIKRALAEGRFAAGDYFLNLLDQTSSLAFSQPVFDPAGKLSGVLSAAIEFRTYGPLFDRFSLPDDSFLGLLDRNGVRLYFHPPKDTNPVGRPIKNSVWEKMKAGEPRGIFTDIGSDGISRLFAYTALTLPNGSDPYFYVVYSVPEKHVTAASVSMLLRNTMIMVAAALFAFASAFVLSQRLFGKRLACIIGTTIKIAAGDLGARCRYADEHSDLGRIAGAVNSMAGTLQLREAETMRYAESLSSSLAEKNVLLKEVHHRVKNNLQMIASLIRLQDDANSSPESFREDLENRVAAIAMVHEMLYKSDDMRSVDLGDYAGQLVELIVSSSNAAVEIESSFDFVPCNIDKAISFGLLLNELVLNAYKHAFKEGRGGSLSVSLAARDGSARFEVRDDGPGLPPGFSIEKGSSLGLRLVDALADQLDGTLEWANDGPGARFTVAFPVGSPS